RLRGRDGDDEERDDLTARIVQMLTESRQRDVDRIQHDLDRHEHQDDVAAAEEADQPDRKEHGAKCDARADRDHHAPAFLLATTTAPTMAARRISEAISNGSVNRVKSACPIAERLPGEGSIAAARPAAGTRAGSRANHASAAKPTPAAAESGQCAPKRGSAASPGRSRSIRKKR